MHYHFKIIFILFLLSIFQMNLFSQEKSLSWKRSEEKISQQIHLFHSTHAINLSTAAMLQKGDFEFEISHRFLPTVNEGSKALWGFDGPANIKMSFGYAITNYLVTSIIRSNLDDNLIIKGNYQLFQEDNTTLPLLVALEGGIAWNSDPIGRSSNHNMNFQYYGQIIFNTLIIKKFGIGLIPSYLFNSHIYCPEKEYSFTLGTYVQYYFNENWSLLTEWNKTITGFRNKYDSFGLGLEIETGGHFFKLVMTNNSNLNPTQFISGADIPITVKNWHLGFNITRILKF